MLSPKGFSTRLCSEKQLMKSVMACTPLNSISQSSTIGLNGFLLLPSRYHCKIHPDLNMLDDVRSQWCSFGFTSKPSLKSWSPTFSQQPHPTCTPLCFPSAFLLCVARYAHPWIFVRIFVNTLHWLCCARQAGRRENIKACNFDAGSVATCITCRQKLCCCLGIDINWPFQSPTNTELLLFFLFIQRADENSVCSMQNEAIRERHSWNYCIHFWNNSFQMFYIFLENS